MSKNLYQKLTKIYEQYYNLNNINSILTWDLTVKMPHNGYNLREKQLSLIEKITSNTIDNNTTKELFKDIDPTTLNSTEQRNFFLMKRNFLHTTSIPEKLRKTFLSTSLKSEFIWRKAKHDNDFPLFDKYFSKTITLLQEICTIKSETLKISPYETLLDQYDPGLTEEKIDILFNKLEKNLPNLITKIINKQKSHQQLTLPKISPEKQKLIYTKILKKIGLSLNWSRIDESIHPFCTGYPGDVRITTRYCKDDFVSGLMGLIHETGHAIYDNNLPKKHILQPIGQSNGMSLHESQSLFMEMQIARSYSFSKFILPMLKKEFDLDNSYNINNFYNHLNKVEKGYIRVNADEATYPLHIIMRYQIEKDLIYKKINTSDLPEIWNHKMHQYFSLAKPSNSQGCLQDIHWSDGSLGYFPTYTIGAIYAAQIAEKIKNTLTDFNQLIENGDFKPIVKILNKNIHNQASLLNSQDIIEKFSGTKLNVDSYLNYIKTKYQITTHAQSEIVFSKHTAPGFTGVPRKK